MTGYLSMAAYQDWRFSSESQCVVRPCSECCGLGQVRKNGTVPWLRPDGKTQVTVEYKKDDGAMVPQRVHTILISTQHSPDVTNDQIHKDLMEHVIKAVVPAKYLDDKTIFHLNPSGQQGTAPNSCLACCPIAKAAV